MEYIVSDWDQTVSTRVKTATPYDAAIRGACKLGMRWMGRKPCLAAQYTHGSNVYCVYGPSDSHGNQYHIGTVRVTGMKET